MKPNGIVVHALLKFSKAIVFENFFIYQFFALINIVFQIFKWRSP